MSLRWRLPMRISAMGTRRSITRLALEELNDGRDGLGALRLGAAASLPADVPARNWLGTVGLGAQLSSAFPALDNDNITFGGQPITERDLAPIDGPSLLHLALGQRRQAVSEGLIY